MTDQDQAGSDERGVAARLFNGVWELLEKEDRTVEDDDRMLHMAHASRYHWGQVGTDANRSRGEWQCSRVYAVLGRAEPALHHARRGLEICEKNGFGDWDLAFAYESLARASAVDGDLAAVRAYAEQALAVDIADNENRQLLIDDLSQIEVSTGEAGPQMR